MIILLPWWGIWGLAPKQKELESCQDKPCSKSWQNLESIAIASIPSSKLGVQLPKINQWCNKYFLSTWNICLNRY